MENKVCEFAEMIENSEDLDVTVMEPIESDTESGMVLAKAAAGAALVGIGIGIGAKWLAKPVANVAKKGSNYVRSIFKKKEQQEEAEEEVEEV